MIPPLPRTSSTFPVSAGLLHRRGGDRFHSHYGWLDSRHSFSFAGHHDPQWSGFGPLLVINDDTVQARTGFGRHPHRDMEIISVIVDGALTHRDSLGHSQTLGAGEVQVLSAGTGLIHSEMNEADRPCRFLQIWITPEAGDLPPAYDQRCFDVGGDWTLLIDPGQRRDALRIRRAVRLWRGRPPSGRSLSLPIASDAPGWLQIIDGAVEVATAADPARAVGRLEKGDGLGFEPDRIAAITAVDPAADLLLFELR